MPSKIGLAERNCERNVPALIGLGRFDPRSAFVAAFALGLPITLATAVLAQDRPIYFAQNDKAEKLDALKEREEDLKAARDAQSKAAENQAALKREIEQLGADRRKLNQNLIETAGRIRDVEAHIAATEE
jgi:septal ring factor EnvC (AmiA/AmiB activator)